MTSSAPRRRGARLVHHALVVDGDDTIERVLLPQLRRRIVAHEKVLMVVGAQTAAVIRERLGPDADTLLWAPTDRFYQRLGFTYARFIRFLRDQHARQRTIHLVTEPDIVAAGEAPVDRATAYLSYESMANGVFAGYGCPVTCIWHSRERTAAVIDGVRRVHPHEWTTHGAVDNPGFVPPDEFLGERTQPPMTEIPSGTDVDVTLTSPSEVAGCRTVIARWAQSHHFVPAAAQQVVAATSEVLTNGVRHGQPPIRLRAWYQGDTLIVHVDDHGGRPIPADAGYRPPTTPADPAGLWIARQLADVLLTRSRTGRTAVRMYFPFAVTHRHLDVPHIT